MSALNQSPVRQEVQNTGAARKVVHLPTNQLYDRWSATYDTDGNILQALDTFGLTTRLIPHLLGLLAEPRTTHDEDQPAAADSAGTLYVADLGCGTGRASLLLAEAVSLPQETNGAGVLQGHFSHMHLYGLDSSLEMMNLARVKLQSFATRYFANGFVESISVDFRHHDITGDQHTDEECPRVQVVVSTLVLEHIELGVYFRSVTKLLKPNGFLLLTNMHEDMGKSTFPSLIQGGEDSQNIPTGAGFVDEDNTKIRATSFAHSVSDILSAAKAVGLGVVGQVEEQVVQEWMLRDRPGEPKPLLGLRGKKWIGTKCWCGMIMQNNLNAG